jgi:hypothetical protein
MLNTYKTILSDVPSLSKPKIMYAKNCERVKVISISDPAVIVENSKRNKFPTTLNNLL